MLLYENVLINYQYHLSLEIFHSKVCMKGSEEDRLRGHFILFFRGQNLVLNLDASGKSQSAGEEGSVVKKRRFKG